MIRDQKGRTPQFVLIEDPDGVHDGDRLVLNQFTGCTARCNKYDKKSMQHACRKLYDGDRPRRKRVRDVREVKLGAERKRGL